MDDHFRVVETYMVLGIPHFRKPPCVVEWTWTRMRESCGETAWKNRPQEPQDGDEMLEARNFTTTSVPDASKPTGVSRAYANLVRPEGSTLKMWMVSLGTDPIPWIRWIREASAVLASWEVRSLDDFRWFWNAKGRYPRSKPWLVTEFFRVDKTKIAGKLKVYPPFSSWFDSYWPILSAGVSTLHRMPQCWSRTMDRKITNSG